MDSSSLEKYKEYVQNRLDQINEIIARSAIMDFSRQLEVPRDNQFTETIIGLNTMMNDIANYVMKLKAAEQTQETMVAERTAELQESEARIRKMWDSLPTGVVIIDAEKHVIVYANAAAIEMIGAPREQIIGHICHKYICPAEKGRCPITDLGQTVDKSERKLLIMNGETLPILKTVVPFILDGRKHLIESFFDITVRKRAEEELKKRAEELEKMNRFMVGRELDMIELKKEVNQLLKELRRPEKYTT